MSEPLEPGLTLSLTVERDSGTVTSRYATRPYAGVQFTEGRVRKGGWGPIRRALSDDAGQPQMATASVTINDDDGAIREAKAEDEARFLQQTTAVVEVLSDAGRAADLDPRTLMRARVTEAPIVIDRAGQQRGRSVRLELGDALAPFFDQTIPKQLFSRTDFPDIHRDLENTPIPLIGGEHADYGAEDVAGNSVEKGLIPAIYVGGRRTIDDDPLGGTPSYLTPPTISYSIVGTPGTRTLYYGATKRSAVGETTLSTILVVSDAPDVLSDTDYVVISIADDGDDTVDYVVYGRRNPTPVRRLAVVTGGSPITYEDTGADPEYAPGPPEVNTAQVEFGSPSEGGFFWDFYVVCLGVVEITAIYGSDMATGTEPRRVNLNDTAGVDFLIPGMTGWPHAQPYLEIGGKRITGFYGRGPRSYQHIQGIVTLAVSVCGYEDVGDGSGDSIQQAFQLLQHFLNQFVLQDYKTGAWLSLATWNDGSPATPMLQTSKFADCQDLTKTWLGNSEGYRGAIYLREPVTVREFLQWFYQTFDAFGGTNHHGQYFPVLYDLTGSAGDGRAYREKIEILALENPELDKATVEPRILYQFDYDPDAKKYRSEVIEVKDAVALAAQSLLRDVPVKQQRWTRDADTAQDAMERRRDRLKYPRYRQAFRTKFQPGLEEELGNQIRLTHADGPGLIGYDNRPFLVVAHEDDPTGGVVTLTGYDLYPLFAGSP